MNNKFKIIIFISLLAFIILLSACGDNSALNAMEIQDSTDASVTSDMSASEDSNTEQITGDDDSTAVEIELTPPSDELIRQIEEDYLDHEIKNHNFKPISEKPFYVIAYYGNYDGVVPVMFAGEFSVSAILCDIEIAGSIFHYTNGNTIKIWKNGDFFSIEEAYDQGLLTKEQIAEIAYIHNYDRCINTLD